MKNIFLTMIVLLGFLSGCKKKDDLIEFAPKPEPGQEIVMKARDFLKALDVTGATEIQFDSVSNSYMVNLPDDFNEKKAEVKLALQPDIFLLDSLNKATSDSIIRYSYSGNPPLVIRLRDKTEKYEFYIQVYFNFTGTPAIELLTNEIPIVSGAVRIPARFTAKMGTIPRAPGVGSGILVQFVNKKTGFSTAAEIGDFDTFIQFAGASNFVSNDPFTLEIALYNHNPVVFEGIRFLRGLPSIYIQPSYKFDYSRSDTIKITGGFFLPEKKYTLTFSNDFMANQVTVPVTSQDSTSLSVDKIPSVLTQGSYLVSVHEGDELAGAGNIYLFGNSTRQIETIWQGGLHQSVDRNTQRLTISRGTEFYAKSWPVYYGATATYFDTTKLPRLHLASASTSIDLEPEPARYSWAIAGVTVGFGKYKIPLSLPPGLYTVTGSFPDGAKTTPYWSRISVK
ncbi:hypothetical protein [Dyadobacter sp. SG02]|uniref:hypothetical protein n=1 Tax=Dyadobacter sp. SG02 TaxID=1855291 RepID=UPI00115FB039|nr:hypothetical protein [Dyadobacter sp. SG02]